MGGGRGDAEDVALSPGINAGQVGSRGRARACQATCYERSRDQDGEEQDQRKAHRTHPFVCRTFSESRPLAPGTPNEHCSSASGLGRPFAGDGAYRDRTGDLRLAKPVAGESGEGGAEGESADLAGDSEPPLPGATGSDRRESDRAVGQVWDESGAIDDDPRSQRGPSDDSSTQPEVPGDEPSG